MTGIIEIATTLETKEQAVTIAKQLVEARLAACVQITGPIQSIYRWMDDVCEASEYRCAVKTSQALLPDVMDTIRELHPYDVPELLATEISTSSDAYAEWLQGQLKA